jgi:hypothetical protein
MNTGIVYARYSYDAMVIAIGSLLNKYHCQSYLIHPEMSTPHLDLAVGRYGPRVHLLIRHDGDIEPHPTSLRILNIFEDFVSHINPITPLSAAQEIDSLYLSQTSPPSTSLSDQESRLSREDFLLNLWQIFLYMVE